MTAASLRSRPLYNLEKFVTVWFAASLLIVGAGAPDARLVISGIPLNPIIFTVAVVFSWALPLSRAQLKPLLLIQLPLLPLGITLMWSLDAANGAYKFLNLLLVINTVGPILLYSVHRYGQAEVGRALVMYLLLLLLGAIIYKSAHNGLFNRYTPYLFNGPIVFARLMSVALLLSLFTMNGATRAMLATIFLMAIFWTLSKAPVIAVILTMGMLFLVRLSLSEKLLVSLALVLSGFLIYTLLGEETRMLMERFLARIDVLKLASNTDLSRHGDFTSISVRYWMAVHTIELIGQQPLGVGIGSWAASISNNLGLEYPHNLPLELWAEGGILLGSIALASYVSVFFAPTNAWKYIAICLLINQMFSGSLLDSRYILIVLILSFYAGTTDADTAHSHQ